jgi:hypothetical protein
MKLLRILKALAYATVVVVGAFVCLLLFQASNVLQKSQRDAHDLATQAAGLMHEAEKSAALSAKLINDARLTLDNLNKASIDERFYFEKQLPDLMDQANGILVNVRTATADLHPLLVETTARTAAIADVEKGANKLIDDTDQAMLDPHIAATLANLDASSASLAVAGSESAKTMGSVQAMAADGQAEVHSLTHPRPIVTIADWTLKVIHALGGFF